MRVPRIHQKNKGEKSLNFYKTKNMFLIFVYKLG